jgi:hypothetical protein
VRPVVDIFDHPQILAEDLVATLVQLGLSQLARLSARQRNAEHQFVIGLEISLWSANGGIKALFDAPNVVYDE